ncbi:hypothetical protein QFC22_003328 [Naganishia vaughanmartiniae]|uniref:Uncharacterized protein n=1 Tax=Naganishia vaughanmartiniae TaxID=1424756 RepID=A0ACC2X6C7_9TREE|nr:hypothetical protein QFC22_003328 [Naganishia vaughanmartiniae]
MGIYDIAGMAKSLENLSSWAAAAILVPGDTKGRSGPKLRSGQTSGVSHRENWRFDGCWGRVSNCFESKTVIDSRKIEKSTAQVNTIRGILSTMQTYYPEKLGWAMVQNLGIVSKALLNIIWPFVDSYTKEKVQFDVDIRKSNRVNPDLVVKRLGGNADFEYDLASYWPDLLQTCLQRRAAELEKWRQAGGRVGTSELVFKIT